MLYPKYIISLIVSLCFHTTVSAQIHTHGNPYITNAEHTHVVAHDGNIDLDGARLHRHRATWVIQNEGGPFFIDASTPIPFANVRLQGNETQVVLGQYVRLEEELEFAGGRLDLYNEVLQMDFSASLVNENADSYMTASGHGFAWIEVVLGEPINENPGNLGITLNAHEVLGTTEVRRSHQQIELPSGKSIQRVYFLEVDLEPVSEATTVFSYLPHELDGIDSETLALWHSEDEGNSWNMVMAAVHDEANGNFTIQDGFKNGMYTFGTQILALQGTNVDLSLHNTSKSTLSFHPYPNPTIDLLNIDHQNSDDNPINFSLLDSYGRIIFEQEATGTNTTISLEQLPVGTYWLRSDLPHSLPKRIIKQKG